VRTWKDWNLAELMPDAKNCRRPRDSSQLPIPFCFFRVPPKFLYSTTHFVFVALSEPEIIGRVVSSQAVLFLVRFYVFITSHHGAIKLAAT
jgi:hypothetical protein